MFQCGLLKQMTELFVFSMPRVITFKFFITLICSGDASKICFKTNQLTLSLLGGVVSELL